MSKNNKKLGSSAEAKSDEKLNTKVLKNYGAFGKVQKVELPEINNDEELRLYAAMAFKD